jgi:hypothetical protein
MLYLQAMQAYNAFNMKKSKSVQYTIRQVPDRVDQRLRETAAAYGTSVNTAAIDALSRGLGMGMEPVVYHDLDDLAGSWVPDPEFDRIVKDMDQVDEGLWK